MGRKNRSRKRKDPGQSEDFKVNPFAGLHLDVPAVPEDEIPAQDDAGDPPDAGDEQADLSAADRELLQAFSGGEALEFRGRAPRVHLQLQQRARGKKVTSVSGLESMDTLEQMEMARELKKRLGIGASFNEGILELQGDQRQRAMDWFQSQGYDVVVEE